MEVRVRGSGRGNVAEGVLRGKWVGDLEVDVVLNGKPVWFEQHLKTL